MSTREVKIAYDSLQAKLQLYNKLWSYYDGDHPLVYSSERLKEVFRDDKAFFAENWCSVVVDAALNKIRLKGFSVGSVEEFDDQFMHLWKHLELDLDSRLVHLSALVTGESMVIAWKNENEEVVAYYNDPCKVHVQYDPENPKKIAWAAKWWPDEQDHYHLTLYFDDHLEYYVSSRKGLPNTYQAFQPDVDLPAAENPFKQIPVFHFRRDRRGVFSEIRDVIPIQSAINKLLSDMMITAEFGAFKQRWVISNADTTTLKNKPNEIWELPAADGEGQNTQVGEFSASDLANYTNAMDRSVGVCAAISKTPLFYFFREGGTPSGEALVALETPLNTKVQDYIDSFGNTWQRVAAFLMALEGKEIDPEEITPRFASPETVQPLTQSQIRESTVRSGVPLMTALRWEGRSSLELEQIQRDREEEQKSSMSTLASALLEKERSFDQGREIENG